MIETSNMKSKEHLRFEEWLKMHLPHAKDDPRIFEMDQGGLYILTWVHIAYQAWSAGREATY